MQRRGDQGRIAGADSEVEDTGLAEVVRAADPEVAAGGGVEVVILTEW